MVDRVEGDLNIQGMDADILPSERKRSQIEIDKGPSPTHDVRIGDKFFLDNKINWFRMPVRERALGADKTEWKVGAQVLWRRSIARMGYFLSPNEIPRKELYERILSVIQFAISTYAVPRSYDPGKRDELMRFQILQILRQMGLRNTDDVDILARMFPTIAYAAKGQWLTVERDRSRLGGETRDLDARTLWFIDHPATVGVIIDSKEFVMGNQIDSCGGEEDYTPAGFSRWLTQKIFMVRQGFPNVAPLAVGQTVWVHPSDLTIFNETALESLSRLRETKHGTRHEGELGDIPKSKGSSGPIDGGRKARRLL